MKLNVLVAGVCALCAGASFAANDYYQWRGKKNDWRLWGEAANWFVTNTETHVGADATTPPGANDSIRYLHANSYVESDGPTFYLWSDLGGQTRKLKELHLSNGSRSLSFLCVNLTNGALTVTGTYEYYGSNSDNAIWNGATFTIAETVAHCYEGKYNAGNPPWIVKAGGTLNMLANQLDMFNSYHMIEEGGTLRLEPKKVTWLNTAYPNRYVNRGTLVMTNGFDMTGSAAPNNAGSTLSKTSSLRRDGWSSYVSFDHLGGTFKMGGLFSNGGLTDGGYYVTWQNSCAVEVVRDLRFSGFDCAVSNKATVALSVAAGATADLSTFHFGEETTVTKTGAGTLLVGTTHPTALDVQTGALELTVAAPDLTGITFAKGVAIVFGYCGETRIDAFDGFASLDFAVDTNRVASGTTFFTSASGELLAHVMDRVNANLPETLTVLRDGTSLVLLANAANVIDVTDGVDLSEKSELAGLDVILRGHGTATFSASAPAFKSLSLEMGATLRAAGGTQAEPLVLPAFSATPGTKILFEEDSFAFVTNGWAFTGNETSLAIFEIATNAIVCVRDAAYPSKPVTFKNVDFRLYGQLRVPEIPDSGGSHVFSQMYFGYADYGETTYLKFHADGGSIYAHHATPAYVGNRSLVAIASPASGGRVKVMDTVVLRNFRKIQDLSTPDNPEDNDANSGYFFGVNNPVDETFDVLVDHSLLAPGGPTKFAGGSRTRFVNGARLARPNEYDRNHSYGHTRGAWICDAATVSFDGGEFLLDRPLGTSDLGKGLNVSAKAEPGATALTLAGGARLTLWETYGDMSAVCAVTNGVFTVPRMVPPRLDWDKNKCVYTLDTNSQTVTNTPAFNGYRRVDILAGGRLVFDASDAYVIISCEPNYGTTEHPEWTNPYKDGWFTDWWEWHRKTALERPVAGAGDIIVTNTLAGTDRRNADGWVSTSVTNFPDLSYWEMNLVMRCPSNTCTGVIRAATDVKAYVQFADGANWAGTVVGNSHLRLGDSIAEVYAAEAPAKATFGAVRFEGDLPIRLWKNETAQTNDFIEITGASATVRGGLCGVGRSGYVPERGVWFRVGRCLKSDPPTAARRWRVRLTDDPSDATRAFVDLSYCPPHTVLLVR